MSQEQIGMLLTQHTEMIVNLDRLWVAFIALLFVGLFLILIVFGLAAWSVRRVTSRQIELEGKFTLLIDVLLQSERNRREDIASGGLT